MALKKTLRRAKIKRRIRKKVFGTTAVPRLSVFRSNKQIYAQIIDDTTGKTLASAGSLKNDAASGVAKSQGSSNPHNVVKATMDALSKMRDASAVLVKEALI